MIKICERSERPQNLEKNASRHLGGNLKLSGCGLNCKLVWVGWGGGGGGQQLSCKLVWVGWGVGEQQPSCKLVWVGGGGGGGQQLN